MKNRRSIPSRLYPLIEAFLLGGWTINRWWAADGPEHRTGFAIDATPRIHIQSVLSGTHLAQLPDAMRFVDRMASDFTTTRFDVEHDHVHAFMGVSNIDHKRIRII